jgi:hypothetical protein
MIIMSVDPGDTTGIFVYDTATGEKRYLIITADSIANSVKMINPSWLIVERKPQNEQWNQILRNQYDKITGVLPEGLNYELKLITPGIWKPVAKAMGWKVTGVSQHVKDAYNILRYAVLIYLNREMEDYNVEG